MTFDPSILIHYRIDKAKPTLKEAELLIKAGSYNAAVNRLYYACFYAVLALLASKNFSSSKHSGVRSLFSKEFVKSEEIDARFYKFYAKLFDNRQEGDYKDFKEFQFDEVNDLYTQSREFIQVLETKLDLR